MDKRKVAAELVSMAKELIGADKANEIANFIMNEKPNYGELAKKFDLSEKQSDKIIRGIQAHAFGPGGKGFNWAVKEIGKILKQK